MNKDTPIDADTALQFRVSAEWAHFRRIDTTTVKQSYRIIPRTTVEGLIGAILGRSRDSYYNEFNPETTGIAISLDTPIRTKNIAKLELSSTDNELTTRKGHTMYRMESMANENRQQRLSEYIVNPSYTITLATDEDELHGELQEVLEQGRSVYTPSLGTSECLASIEYLGSGTLQSVMVSEVDSVAPTDIAEATGEIGVERTPRHIEVTESGRQPTEFVSYAYDSNGGPTPLIEETPALKFNEQIVLFI